MTDGGHSDGFGSEIAPGDFSEFRHWAGPSATVTDMGTMKQMMFPIDAVLRDTPPAEGMSEDEHEASIRNALSVLECVHNNIDALTPPPPGYAFNFAEIVYLAAVYAREEVLDKALAAGEIDAEEHAEMLDDVRLGGRDVCNAFDKLLAPPPVPRQRNRASTFGRLLIGYPNRWRS